MLMKLALRNVRRSVRDYAVYFVTLTLGVAVFYAFNAIGDSRVLFEAQEGAENMFLASGASVFDILSQVMTYFSVVVAVVLGFLVLYANRFVVRARKKEFGTYLLLGMSPRQVSSVVLMETLIVGVLALVVGLGLGFLISQAIAFATAGLIGVAISDYHLLFSVRSARADPGLFRAHLRRGRPVQCRADLALQACHAAVGQLPQRAHARAQPHRLPDRVRAVVPDLGEGVRGAQPRRPGVLRRALPHRNRC